MIHAKINGIDVEVEQGSTILQAATAYGIEIPTLCYIKELDPEASCRMCMVEIEGMPKLVTACSHPIAEGQVIFTESERVVKSRKGILDLLLSKHDKICFSCWKNGDCKLQDLCFRYGVHETTYPKDKLDKPIDDSSRFFKYNPNLCILCHRCVNTCQKLVGCGAIDTTNRGYDAMMAPPLGLKWNETVCESCGNCVSACPVGALTPKSQNNFRQWETHKVRTTCTYCGVGCQVDLLVKEDKVVDVRPADGPANHGLLCVKGRFAFDFVNNKNRITTPLVRKNGELTEATWDEAMDVIASKIKEVKEEFGPDAVAGFSSARASNEDNYIFQKFLRAAVGTNSVDHCARL